MMIILAAASVTFQCASFNTHFVAAAARLIYAHTAPAARRIHHINNNGRNDSYFRSELHRTGAAADDHRRQYLILNLS